MDGKSQSNLLDQVACASEAARIVGYSRQHVVLLCDTGRVEAKKSGGNWIVVLSSLLAYEPKIIRKS